jgi:hypothetical protein
MSQHQFIERPGIQERQLKRRHLNPLFSLSKQQVSASELKAARQHDKQEVINFTENLQSLLAEVTQFSAREETDTILETKEKADRLYEQCIGLTGDHERERQGLLKLNEVIMAAIKQAAGSDPLASEELDKEQQAREIHLALLECQLVADILRPDGMIEEDDLLPTLLSEDEESIQMAMTLFSGEQQQLLHQQAAELKQRLQDDGQLKPEIENKFNALIRGPQ